MKMEQTECFETSAYKIQTPGNHPKESIKVPGSPGFRHQNVGERMWSKKSFLHTNTDFCYPPSFIHYYQPLHAKYKDYPSTSSTISSSCLLHVLNMLCLSSRRCYCTYLYCHSCMRNIPYRPVFLNFGQTAAR